MIEDSALLTCYLFALFIFNVNYTTCDMSTSNYCKVSDNKGFYERSIFVCV